MMFALAWLTISIPFVYAAQQAIKAESQAAAGCEEANPFASTTEEKSESGTTSISEYLIELLHQEQPYSIIINFYKRHSADLYLAFQPEAIYPPPKA